MDNILDALTEHLNQIDDTGSIKFIDEQEKDSQIAFLDMFIVRKENGNVSTAKMWIPRWNFNKVKKQMGRKKR